MQLQMAIDVADLQGALALAGQTAQWVDIFEVGTPLLLREGLHAVRALKERLPDKTVLADTKIVDGGAMECGDAVRAGADIVTVLAIADEATVSEVVAVAHEHGRRVMADLIMVPDIPDTARRMQALGVDYVCVHTGVDAQKSGRTPLGDLERLLTAAPPENAAVAGGIGPDTVAQYAALRPAILIAGSALAGAADPRAAAQKMKEAMR